jgi:peptide/nickel transport system substrate-binding protein
MAASLTTLLLALPLLGGCQPKRSSPSLIVATKSRIDSLDPVQASRIGVMQVLSGLGDPLYAIDSNGRLEPRLATALPVLSSDGMRARIPLRQGVLFHDGTRFDADAMAFSLRRFMAIGTLGYQLSERVESVRVTAPHEIELVLKRPFSPLPRLLSAIFLTPVSPTAYRQHRDKPLNDRFVGTGPYALAFFGGQQQRLVPWSRYWGRRPANGGIDLVTLSNSTALFGALRSGEVDLLLNSGLEIDHQQALHRDAAAGRLREAIGPAQGIALVSLLTDQPPLNRTVLRQAVARSLDRTTIIQRVTLGLRSPQRQLIPPSLPGSDPSAWPAYDPAAARALYRQAGYCQGKVLTLPLTYRSDIPTDRLFALTWQAQLRRDLSDCVTLEVSGMEATTAYSQLDKGALTMLFYDWVGDYPDAENFLTPLLSCSKAEGNRCLKGNSVVGGSFWTAPGLEAELQRSSQLDGPDRTALLVAIQRRVAKANPYLPVWLSAPAAWGSLSVSQPRFDGSGRVRLDELRRLPTAAGAGLP